MSMGELIVLVFWGAAFVVSWLGMEHPGLMGTVILLGGMSAALMWASRED